MIVAYSGKNATLEMVSGNKNIGLITAKNDGVEYKLESKLEVSNDQRTLSKRFLFTLFKNTKRLFKDPISQQVDLKFYETFSSGRINSVASIRCDTAKHFPAELTVRDEPDKNYISNNWTCTTHTRVWTLTTKYDMGNDVALPLVSNVYMRTSDVKYKTKEVEVEELAKEATIKMTRDEIIQDEADAAEYESYLGTHVIGIEYYHDNELVASDIHKIILMQD